MPARPEARFCDACGAELAGGGAGASGDQARKVVTILFADLVGSTSAQEGADPEAVRRWVDRYYAVLRRVVEAHGGRVAKFTGDGVMAVFGIPEVREDDARRALAAADALHAAVTELGGGAGAPERVALRVGVNTGEVVVTPDDDDVVGDVVNVAARLQTAAGAGQVLVGEATFRLVRVSAQLRALPPFELKGKSAPVNAFLLTSLTRGEEAPASPFVGRAGELERLLAVLDDAIRARRARLASIVGSPGVGKTRLARELAARAGDRARVVDVRCEAVGGSTFAPIAAALRQAAALEDDASPETVVAAVTALFDEDEADRHRVAAGVAGILGVGEPGLPEETFWAVRRLIENAGQRGPIVFVFDDVHWAEPLLLDLIENVAEWTRGAPVMLLLTARPELRDLRPSLVEVGGRVQAAISLEGLEVDESHRLARALVGGVDLPGALLDRVASASEGNPLFVGELVRMLLDDGVLELVDGAGRMTVDAAQLDVPVTIHALLGARIDRLAPGERSVLEAASVVGKTFYRGVLAALVAPELRPHIDEHLEGLRRKELVEPAGTYWLDEPVLRFHHVLVRDAAYRRLLKETRAALHEQAARWLEVKVGDLVDHDDVIGYQLEQAHLLHLEAGHQRAALGREAADRLAAAGRRALEADDRPSAAALLGRALGCLPDGSEDRGELLIDRCEALLAMGDATEAAGAVLELLDIAAGSARLEAWASCFAGELANLRDAGALAETAARAEEAARRLAGLDDAAGEAKAHAVRAASLARLGRIAECEASLDRALAAARRRTGDRRRQTAILAGAPVAALWGPNPVTRASGRCLDVVRVLRITSRSPAVEATSLRCQAVLEALRGRDDAARRMLGSARRSLEELGQEHGLLEVDLAAGMTELLADRPEDAEVLLRRAHEGFHALGADVDAGLAAALLARVRLGAGDVDEALELTVESEKLGGDDLKAGIAWRAVRAEALAQRGELERALRLAERAVALAAPTDALLDHADALLALAEVLRSSGDEAAAVVRAREALDLYDRKEASVPAARARAFVGGEPTPAAPPEPRQPAAARAPDPAPPVKVDEAAGERGPLPLRNLASTVAQHGFDLCVEAGWEELATLLDDAVESTDHRPIVGGGFRHAGIASFIENVRTVPAIGVSAIESTAVAIRGAGLALLRVRYGGDPSDGHIETLQLVEVTDGGRLARNDVYDFDQLGDACAQLDRLYLARLDPELAVQLEVSNPIHQRLMAQDWDGVAALLAPDFRGVDHRQLGWGEVDRARFGELYRAWTAQAPDALILNQQVHCITRDGVCATSVKVGRSSEGADFETESVAVVQVRAGAVARIDWFAAAEVGRAMAFLRALGVPGPPLENAATRFWDRWLPRLLAADWVGVGEVMADDVVGLDSRPLLGETDTLVGRDAVIEGNKGVLGVGVSSLELAPVALGGDRWALASVRYAGRAGSTEVLQLFGVDEDGRLRHSEVFELTQRDQALVRLRELSEAPSEGDSATVGAVPPNEAVRFFVDAFELGRAGRWDEFTERYRPDVRITDHRPLVGGLVLEGREQTVPFTRSVFEAGAERLDAQPVATAGDRVAIVRSTYFGHQASVELLELLVLDEEGRGQEAHVFEPGQLAEAAAGLRELWLGTLGPEERAWADPIWSAFERASVGDVVGLARHLTDDFVLDDHREASFGTIDKAAWLAVLADLFERAPDSFIHGLRILGLSEHGVWTLLEVTGSLEGGPYSTHMLVVIRRGGDRMARMDIFPPDDLASAEARFEALPVEAARGVTPWNEADRVTRIFHEASGRGDAMGMLALTAPGARIEDRRPVVGASVSGDELLPYFEALCGLAPFDVAWTPLAARGDRLALGTMRFSASGQELTALVLGETDGQGRSLGGTANEPDRVDEAFAELERRFVAGEGAPVADVWEPIVRLVAAATGRDPAAIEALLHPRFVALDHRSLGFGRLERDEYPDHLAPIWKESPDARWTIVRDLAICQHGALFEFELSGTRAGGPFARTSLLVMEVEGSRVARLDTFELADRAAAEGRYAELASAPASGALENAATRSYRDTIERGMAGDWATVAARMHPTVRTAGLAFARAAMEAGVRQADADVVAVRGTDLVLLRVLFSGSQGAVENLTLLAIDAEGRWNELVVYDVDQLDEAFEHLDELFLADAGARSEAWRAVSDATRSLNRRDIAGFRALGGDDVIVQDHRRLGLGTLSFDQYLGTFPDMFEQAPDARWHLVEDLGISPETIAARIRTHGHTPDGGPFVVDTLMVGTFGQGHGRRLELFDVGHLAAARARFEELAGESA